ncbi:hypothetical protein [Nocardia abscessus]|uniref:hypothetical protein n=1 Tax=Nocardia abscessus TaxID=120957 RepID=UPI0024539A15|nr:hypothetical protein [Nocardia abscessus]
MSTPKDPEHTDDEQRPSESPSLSKQTGDTSGEEPAQPLTGAAPAQTPGAQPTEHDPAGARAPAARGGRPQDWAEEYHERSKDPLGSAAEAASRSMACSDSAQRGADARFLAGRAGASGPVAI